MVRLLGNVLAVVSLWTLVYLDVQAELLIAFTAIGVLVSIGWPALPGRLPAVIWNVVVPILLTVAIITELIKLLLRMLLLMLVLLLVLEINMPYQHPIRKTCILTKLQ